MRRFSKNFTPRGEQTIVGVSESSHFPDSNPILTFWKESRPYIWIGADGPVDKRCFGTISGRTTIRKLAHALLEAIGEKP